MGARLFLVIAVWSGCTAVGVKAMLDHQHTPGSSGQPAATWPIDSALKRTGQQPTLVSFIHPHCPCSRASITELAKLLGDAQCSINTHVVFVKPEQFADGWEKTALWTTASKIPGAIVTSDPAGVEATRFGAATSGSVSLYDADGTLLFSGGVTSSRGHEGSSLGQTTLASLLSTGAAPLSRTAVYGCELSSCPAQ